MVCYRVIASWGEWEDYYSHCEGCYIDEKQAIKRKAELEAEELERRKQGVKCVNCEYGANYTNEEPCSDYSSISDEDRDCRNYYCDFEDITYTIETEEVIGLQELINKLG